MAAEKKNRYDEDFKKIACHTLSQWQNPNPALQGMWYNTYGEQLIIA